MKKTLEILKKDIETVAHKIASGVYTPLDVEVYNLLACAIKHTKMLWHEDGGEVEPEPEPEWLLRNIESELDAVEKYCKKFTKAKNVKYKTIAKQELEHAMVLIAEIKAMQLTVEESAMLAELQARADALQHKM